MARIRAVQSFGRRVLTPDGLLVPSRRDGLLPARVGNSAIDCLGRLRTNALSPADTGFALVYQVDSDLGGLGGLGRQYRRQSAATSGCRTCFAKRFQ